jgi:DNA-binding MarR family transcriptional regulator
MTDINQPAPLTAVARTSGEDTAASELVACVELFFFAYRDFTSDPDAILADYGFGRAHHRVLHFVHRNPGLKVAELLDILKITKQSLARVLKELRTKGFILRRPGPEDLRERRLYATARGHRLAMKLTALQVKRIAAALAKAGPGAEATMNKFLLAMIRDQDQPHVEALIKASNTWRPLTSKEDAS